MATAKIRQNDICKDLLMKRKKMGELNAEILTKYRRYARDKKAQLFEEGYVDDEHEYWLRHYCASWLRDKKPSRMDKSNKRRRTCPVHKATAKKSRYERRAKDWWGFTEAMWNDYSFSDKKRKNPKQVMWKNRKELYIWIMAMLRKQNYRSAYRNEKGIYPKLTRVKDGNLTPKENFLNKTNLSIDRILPHRGYVEGNMVLCQRQQNKDKNAIHLHQTEDVVKLQRKATKQFSRSRKL
tara:strand:- start:2412 stop:3125 length:714 start_codon:yes stop_codon:yes gene_type:complete